MAKSKSHRYKPRPKKPQTAKMQQEEPMEGANRQMRRAQAKAKQNEPPVPVSGNRQARRAQEQNPNRRSAGKPMWIRILIVVFLIVMVLGFIITPLLGR